MLLNLILLKILIFISFPISIFSQNPNIQSKAYIIKNTETGVILSQKSPEWVQPMASLTKLGTALMIFEISNPNEILKASDDVLVKNSYESSAGLKLNEDYYIKDLYYGLLLPSGNDVARLFGKKLESGGKDFNSIVKDWKLKNQLDSFHPAEPVGLSKLSKSNSLDLIKVLDLYLKNPFLFNVLQTREYSFLSLNKDKIRVLSRTPIADFSGIKIFGKTGKTKSAGLCFAGFLSGKSVYQLVILGSIDLEADLKEASTFIKKNE